MFSSESAALFSVSLVFISLAILAVILRFYARKKKELPILMDDWLILLVLIITMAIAVMACWGSWKAGFGSPPQDLSPKTTVIYLKLLAIGNLLTIVCIAIVKISVLQFYKRIFRTTNFVRAANIMIAIIVIWMLLFILLLLFISGKPSNKFVIEPSNVPLSANNHFGFAPMFIASVVLDIAFDIIVLCFPIPMIVKLQMSFERKLAVIAVLWLGACCVIASIVRLVYVVEYTKVYSNPTVQFSSIVVNITIWSQIEPCMSIVAACLPPLSPLFGSGKRTQRWISSIRTFISNRSFFHISRKQSRPSGENSQENTRNFGSRRWEKMNPDNPRLQSQAKLKPPKLRDVEQQRQLDYFDTEDVPLR